MSTEIKEAETGAVKHVGINEFTFRYSFIGTRLEIGFTHSETADAEDDRTLYSTEIDVSNERMKPLADQILSEFRSEINAAIERELGKWKTK